MKTSIAAIVLFVGLLVSPWPLLAQTREAATVENASQVVNEIMQIPVRSIPEALLADAKGLVIIPDLLKGSFVVGVRHGRGVVVIRDEQGVWKPPVLVTLTGGSVGWQIGLQATDIILVFKTRNSVQGLLSGKFTLGADAAAAAGPVGREAAAATDATLKAEIYTYSRSRGLFAGISLDGSVLQIDSAATAAYYAGTNVLAAGAGPQASGPLPPSATRLLNQIAKYTSPAGGVLAQPAMVPVDTSVARPADPVEAQQIRRQLAESAQRLNGILNDNWNSYLALPAEVYSGDRAPSAEVLGLSLSRYEAVAGNPRYQSLAQRAEFQTTYGLLKRYNSIQTSTARNSPTLALPPPPR